MIEDIDSQQSVASGRIITRISFKTVFFNVSDYLVWLMSITTFSAITLATFQFDLIHIGTVLAISWLTISLYYMKKLMPAPFSSSKPVKAQIIPFLKSKFPEYDVTSRLKTIVLYRGITYGFRRRKITVIIDKDAVYINWMTLGQFDMPSVFHVYANWQRSKKLADELAQTFDQPKTNRKNLSDRVEK